MKHGARHYYGSANLCHNGTEAATQVRYEKPIEREARESSPLELKIKQRYICQRVIQLVSVGDVGCCWLIHQGQG